jgi:hypothetical protein
VRCRAVSVGGGWTLWMAWRELVVDAWCDGARRHHSRDGQSRPGWWPVIRPAKRKEHPTRSTSTLSSAASLRYSRPLPLLSHHIRSFLNYSIPPRARIPASPIRKHRTPPRATSQGDSRSSETPIAAVCCFAIHHRSPSIRSSPPARAPSGSHASRSRKGQPH